MVSKTYGRVLEVRIGKRLLKGFDCAFTISRSLDMFSNTASITAYNLSSETRKAIHAEVQGVDCEVRAGYANDPELARFFRGNLRVISSKRQAADWVTTVESGDGDVVSGTQVSKSYAEGFSIKGVVQDLVKEIKAESGNIVSAFLGIDDKPLSGPLTVQGSANLAIKDSLEQLGLEHSWQDNAIQVLERHKALNGTTAVLLTPDTGLLDSPEIQGIRGFIRVPIARVRSLLNANITPGRLLRVESSSWTGNVVARKVTHTGQSWGGEWITDVEGVIEGTAARGY